MRQWLSLYVYHHRVITLGKLTGRMGVQGHRSQAYWF